MLSGSVVNVDKVTFGFIDMDRDAFFARVRVFGFYVHVAFFMKDFDITGDGCLVHHGVIRQFVDRYSPFL